MPGYNAGHFLPAAPELNQTHSNPDLRISLILNNLPARKRSERISASLTPNCGALSIVDYTPQP
jgi:hypothetical protein